VKGKKGAYCSGRKIPRQHPPRDMTTNFRKAQPATPLQLPVWRHKPNPVIISSSPPRPGPPPDHPTEQGQSQSQTIELVHKPDHAYFSPYRASPSFPFTVSTETVNECCSPRPAQAPRGSRMGLSKSQRIGVLLGIDTAFFLVELIVGV